MKATFSKLPAPKKRSTSVSSFTYVPIATSSLLSYLFSPTQGCVSAEVQVSYRPKFKEKKKQRVFLQSECQNRKRKCTFQPDGSSCTSPACLLCGCQHLGQSPVLLLSLWAREPTCSQHKPGTRKDTTLLVGLVSCVLSAVALGCVYGQSFRKQNQPSPSSLSPC